MLIAVNYHYIRRTYDYLHPGIHGTTPQRFEAHLDLMGSVAPFLSLSDLIEIRNGRRSMPDAGWVITFDDGLAEQYHLALPILKRKGIPAAFFVSTKPIMEGTLCEVHRIQLLRAHASAQSLLRTLQVVAEKFNIDFPLPDADRGREIYIYDSTEDAGLKYLLNYQCDSAQRDILLKGCFENLMVLDESSYSKSFYMDTSMIKELHELNCLGSHCHSHLRLSGLSTDAIYREINGALTCFAEMGISKVSAIAYPYGTQDAISPVVIDTAKNSSFEIGFTMDRAAITDMSNPLTLPRFSNSDLPSDKSKDLNIKNIFSNVDVAGTLRSERLGYNGA